MKDFAKSIVCNTKAEVEKVGNATVDEVLKKAQAEVTYKGYKILYYPFYNAYKITSAPGGLTSPWPYEKFKTVEEAKRIIDREKGSVGNAYKPNPEVIKILEDLTWKRISPDEARKKLEAAIKDKNIADLMVANPKGFIPVGNEEVKNEFISSHPDSKVAIEIYETYLKSGKDENKTFEILSGKYKSIPKDGLKKHIKDAIKAYDSITKNSKVGNGSGSWRGNFYEDSAGNSATVMKSGKGWEVVWEDYRGYGKSVGVYKDQSTAKKVAEEVVESEMPERIKANYRSQAINSKVGNKDIFSGNYVVVSEDGEVWFRDEHEQIGITKIDAWAQKRIAEYQRSIDEIKNGVKEAKNAAKKAGII